MPVILVTHEAEIRRITIRSQPQALSPKNPSQKWAGGGAQAVRVPAY
jgi:hypothetical protein